MRTTRKATPIVIATALAVGVIGLTGCSKSSSPSAATPTKAARAAKTTRPATPTPTGPTTKAPVPGVAVAGYEPADVGSAAEFAETFARTAMSGCGNLSVGGMKHLMTPALYTAALKKPKGWAVLTLDSPMVMSQGCVTSQKLSPRQISRGVSWMDMPSIRVAVTVTDDLMVGTTSSPKTLKPITVARLYTVDVLPGGTKWLATNLETGDTTLTTGK